MNGDGATGGRWGLGLCPLGGASGSAEFMIQVVVGIARLTGAGSRRDSAHAGVSRSLCKEARHGKEDKARMNT
jgi:hypothetical protein